MQSFKKKKKLSSSEKLLTYLFLIIIALAVIFRFSHLDKKVFWHDEVYTEFRISGYPHIDVANARLGKVISKDDLMKFQKVSSNKGINDVIKSLSSNAHTPVYFILLKYWQHLWGNSLNSIRALSAVFGVLTLPALFLLCQELFNSNRTAKIAVSLMAVSPMFIRYSQEARPYSLWLLTILVSSYLLLQALRTNQKKSWILYSITIAISFYSHLLSFHFYLGHCIYVLATSSYKKLNTVANYLIASIIGFSCFLPWFLLIMLPNLSYIKSQTAWLKSKIPLSLLFPEHLKNLNHIFISLDFSNTNNLIILYSLAFPHL